MGCATIFRVGTKCRVQNVVTKVVGTAAGFIRDQDDEIRCRERCAKDVSNPANSPELQRGLEDEDRPPKHTSLRMAANALSSGELILAHANVQLRTRDPKSRGGL
jgi:hypothetical protein